VQNVQTALREMHEKIWIEVRAVFYVEGLKGRPKTEGNCVEGLSGRPRTFKVVINKNKYFY
jgi:hypothetical protein